MIERLTEKVEQVAGKAAEKTQVFRRQALPEEVQQLAYQLWEADGRPDGDSVVTTPYGTMTVREYHWKAAEEALAPPSPFGRFAEFIEGRFRWAEERVSSLLGGRE